MASPFIYEEPCPRSELIDREAEAAATLLDRFLDGRNSRLEAPRRYGKTSLLPQGARRLPGTPGSVPLLRQLPRRADRSADVAERIERAYREQLDPPRCDAGSPGWARTLRPTLQGRAEPWPLGAEVTLRPGEALACSIGSRVPRRLLEKHGKRVLRSCSTSSRRMCCAPVEQVDAV